MLIGLHGYAGAGKDAAAKAATAVLRLKGYGVETFSFAEPLRRFICDILDVPREAWDSIKDQPSSMLDGKTPRDAALLFGTKCGRDMIRQDLWRESCLNKARNALERGSVVFITDVRFENEAFGVLDAGGVIVRVERPDQKVLGNRADISEQPLGPELVTATVRNTGTIAELGADLLRVVEDTRSQLENAA